MRKYSSTASFGDLGVV